MRTTIDKAGRVVIPAAVRTKVGLRAGAALDVLVDEGSIRLVRAVPRPKLVRIGKRLVARPTADPMEIGEASKHSQSIMTAIAAGRIRRAVKPGTAAWSSTRLPRGSPKNSG